MYSEGNILALVVKKLDNRLYLTEITLTPSG